MIRMLRRLAVCAALAAVAGAASSQNDDAAAAAKRGGNDDWREKCFLVPGVLDLQVLGDRHVYVRTRGGNHYLLTTAQCDNLERSYVRSEVRLVNYGRRVCERDGSYLLYNSGTRITTCEILTIDPVEDRAAAKLIAAGNLDLVDIEVIDAGERVDPADPSDPLAPAEPSAPPAPPAPQP